MLQAFKMIENKNEAKTMTNICHVIVNSNSVIQHVIKIKNEIIKHVNDNAKVIIIIIFSGCV